MELFNNIIFVSFLWRKNPIEKEDLGVRRKYVKPCGWFLQTALQEIQNYRGRVLIVRGDKCDDNIIYSLDKTWKINFVCKQTELRI